MRLSKDVGWFTASVYLRAFSTLAIFMLLCLNVVVAPVVYAVVDSIFECLSAWIKELNLKLKT